MEILDRTLVKAKLGERRSDCNKGDNGKGLLISGSPGFTGAAVMAAAAAQRAGIGLLKVLCPHDVVNSLRVLPEVMAYDCGADWNSADSVLLFELLDYSTCVAVGPGAGKSEALYEIIKEALKTGKPTVIDADGLNVIAAHKKDIFSSNALITPHPGEMARLLHCEIGDVQKDPQATAQLAAKQFGCTVLLKGSVSYIAAPDGKTAKNTSGNSGLAKGGSGDVLTGIILALLGQGLCTYDAACSGAFILGTSADTAFELLRERMLMARDVIEAVERTVEVLKAHE